MISYYPALNIGLAPQACSNPDYSYFYLFYYQSVPTLKGSTFVLSGSLSLTNKNDLTGNTRKKAPKAIGQQEFFQKEAREKAPGRVEKNWKQQLPNTRGASLSLAELMQNAGFQRTGNKLTGNTREKAPKAMGQQEFFQKEAREKAQRRVEKNWKQQVPNTRGASLSLAELMQNAGFQKTGNKLTGNAREKAPKAAGQQKSFIEKVRIKTPRPMEDNWKQQVTDKRKKMIRFYAERLWNLAHNLLYKEIFLTDFQILQAKTMLEKWYEPVADKKLLTVHQNYCERVYLVRDFIARDPENRFVQLPYRYFDTNNNSGFTGTKIWYAKHKKRKEEIRKKLVLHSQIRKYLNNEKKPQDKKRSVLEVYRECETRVGKLKDRDLLKLFHAAVLNPEIIQQIN